MTMVSGFDVESLNALGKLIGGLERYHLEEAIPREFDPADLFDESEQAFFQIQGLADFWSQRPGVDFGQHMVDLVIGAHNQQQADLTLVMRATPQEISIYISLGSEKATQTILEGIFPGIILAPTSTTRLAMSLRPHFLTQGMITGIPSQKPFQGEGLAENRDSGKRPGDGMQDQAHLERVIRGMHGTTWAYLVQAHPRPRRKVVEERMRVVDTLTQIASHSQVQWSSTKQESKQSTAIETSGQTQSYSGNAINYRAQYLNRLLERQLERIDQAAAAGEWTVRTCFGASQMDDAQRLASLLLGTLAGADSRPEPLRATLCQKPGAPPETFHTFLTSHEVASLIQLPREEVPGYAIHDYVRFDVDFRTTDTPLLPLGRIWQNNKDTQNTFNISLDALAKHAVVLGVTGSGKTTTVMNLLDRLVEADKPFLVIEPAKTEYRSLSTMLAGRARLEVYTLGNEMIAPFRLNPFEFETGDEPGLVPLLTHIDFLKTVFNAAFALYPPMPQVLEEALHEVYEDKGWDIVTGINRRLPDWSERHTYSIFPTLTDLYAKVEEVTTRLRYHHDVESNVKAALKARIGSLRIGSKGLVLDTVRGISLERLLSTPTIIEMERIGSDDEKTFLMGLLLARLFEYRRLQASTDATAQGISSHGLKHLLVFEEAHRLLQNTSTQVSNESSNPRAQAVEAFTNMLSEMRAYGQGVLVAEQIPSKLAPDVLKNTNLKIAHRLIAQDDRQSIGQTMNLNEAQQIHLGVLTPGMAAVHAEGADHAYLVLLENYKQKVTALTDADLQQISPAYASVKPFQFIPNIEGYDVPGAPFGGPDPVVYQSAGKLLEAAKGKWLWANALLLLIANPTNLIEILARFSEHLEAEMSYLSDAQHDALMRMVLVRGCAEVLHARGSQFGWSYPEVETLRSLLTEALVKLTSVSRNLSSRSFLEIPEGVTDEEAVELLLQEAELVGNYQQELDTVSELLSEFVQRYKALMKRRQGPFVGCTHCPAKCLYRPEVNTLLSSKDQKWITDEFSKTSHKTMEERYQAVAKAAIKTAQGWLGDEQRALPIVGYCAALHAFARADFNEYEQAKVANNIQPHIFEKKIQS